MNVYVSRQLIEFANLSENKVLSNNRIMLFFFFVCVFF